jgi:hypothetical protein
METSLNLLLTPEDGKVLHDVAKLVPKLDRKWVVLNNLIPDEIKNKYYSFFRDLGTFMDLIKKLGQPK